MGDLWTKELLHLFGTTDNDKLKKHPKLTFSACGRGSNSLSTYSLRTRSNIVSINECNLNGQMKGKLAEFRGRVAA